MCMVLYVAADEPLPIILATHPPSAFSARPVEGPFQHIGILSLEFHVDKLSRPLL